MTKTPIHPPSRELFTLGCSIAAYNHNLYDTHTYVGIIVPHLVAQGIGTVELLDMKIELPIAISMQHSRFSKLHPVVPWAQCPDLPQTICLTQKTSN